MQEVPILGNTGTEEIPRGATELYLPGGAVLNFHERDVAKAVEEFDPDLVLGQRKDSGEWVIFMKRGPINGEPFPVLGLGTTLPTPDACRKKMFECDVRRHGDKIRQRVQAHNDQLQAAGKAAADEKIGELAERLDFAFQQQGVHPFPTIRMGDKIGNKTSRNH